MAYQSEETKIPGDNTGAKPDAAKPAPAGKNSSATADIPDAPGTGPGSKDVGTIGIVFLSVYLVAAILLCFYGLIALWPGPSPSGKLPPGQTTAATTSVNASEESPTPNFSAEPSPGSSPTAISSGTRSIITVFGRQIEIWDEVRLLLIVILAGALGSLVHTVRSVFWYVGNRFLKWSWLAKYVLQPFAGSALAVIFYVVVRGGFFSPQTTVENTSPFGFAALAAMVGLFSEQAVLKLKEVAETVLSKPAPGADAKPQPSVSPPDETTPDTVKPGS